MDRRVRYTKQILLNALLELLKSKPVEDITVSELCREADVHRNTFYYHYNSPVDLYNEILKALTDGVLSIIEAYLDTADYEGFLRTIAELAYSYRPLLKYFFLERGDLSFLDPIITQTQERVIAFWKLRYPQVPMEELKYLHNYITGGTLLLIRTWARDGFQDTPDQFSGRLVKYTVAVLGDIFTTP